VKAGLAYPHYTTCFECGPIFLTSTLAEDSEQPLFVSCEGCGERVLALPVRRYLGADFATGRIRALLNPEVKTDHHFQGDSFERFGLEGDAANYFDKTVAEWPE
jgi:hypothetical protein